MSVLEKELNAQIARDLQVRPEDVTLELIRRWREIHTCSLGLETEYGGYVTEGLLALDEGEQKAALQEVDELVDELLSAKTR